jgi:hypothetical protein
VFGDLLLLHLAGGDGRPIGFTCRLLIISHVRWLGFASLIAFSALSRKKALIVEPISRT